ncbi:MAG: hypothetical protein AAGH76_10970 [Pseudomonadota bacterium]
MTLQGADPNNSTAFEPHPWQQTIIIVFAGLMLWFINVLWTTGMHVECESLSSFWTDASGLSISVSAAYTLLLCLLIGWAVFELAIGPTGRYAERFHLAVNVASACVVLYIVLVSVESADDVDFHLTHDQWLQGKQIIGITPYEECQWKRRFVGDWYIENQAGDGSVSPFEFGRISVHLDGSLQLTTEDGRVVNGDWQTDPYCSTGNDRWCFTTRFSLGQGDRQLVAWDVDDMPGGQLNLTSTQTMRSHFRPRPNYAIRLSRAPMTDR